ncbi:Crp/Fnr family transcriptional regulator [Roseivirga pacifica]|uniref:Crp/Fnr family transcriptional regulator n=1 Tax=Roseivirga pacifica TaxID=1267423 RepID=UPI002279FB23|nr:Crp/Fnr family transcriptional regulator [Roseivirga pacifica]
MAIPVRPNNESYLAFKFYEYISTASQVESLINVQEQVIKKGEYVYDPSSDHKYIFEVVEGAVKLGSYTDDGDEFTFDVLFKNDFFGDLKYLNNQFFEFSKALIDTKLRVYKRDFFKKMVVQDPQVAEWFISYIVKRWCSTEKKLKKLHEKQADEKLSFMSTFFDIRVEDVHQNSYALIDLLTQKDLGDLIGVTRQTVANTAKRRASEFIKTS